MESTSILENLSSELPEAGFILSDSMKRPKRGTGVPERETFRDYLRRVMAEESLTSRQIEEATGKYGWRVSRSWINLVLTKDEGVENAGIKTLIALAHALSRSREEVFAAFMQEDLDETDHLLTSVKTCLEKLADPDREHYNRVIEDLIRSMRRALR